MLPDPLHPAVVHFPVVLMILAPLFAIGAIWAVRNGTRPHRAWPLAIVMIAALAASAFIAVRTGEAQEDRVEEIVGDDAIHTHEEAAELFLVLSGGLLLLAAVGLAPGRYGRIARGLTVVGSLGLAGVGLNVGRSGGDLVYRHGAADAYIQTIEEADRGEPAPTPPDARVEMETRADDADDASSTADRPRAHR